MARKTTTASDGSTPPGRRKAAASRAARPKAAAEEQMMAAAELPEPTPLRSGLPRRTKPVARATATPDEEALALARRIVELAEDKKASDIVLLEIGGLTTLADYFVICSGQSERQLGAIVDGIASALRDEGIRPVGREGKANAHWLLIDFGSVIVHVMAPPERDFYQLEKLWADAPLLLRLQ